MKVFFCLRCRHPLGETDGTELWIGSAITSAILRRTVTLCCPECRAVRVWRPVVCKKRVNEVKLKYEYSNV